MNLTGRRTQRERRRQQRLRPGSNEPPPTEPHIQAALDTVRAEIEAALATWRNVLDPSYYRLCVDILLAMSMHEAGAEPLTCAQRFLEVVLTFIAAQPLLRDATVAGDQLFRALNDFRAGDPAALNAMIDNRPTTAGRHGTPTAAHERAVIALWIAVLQLGTVGAYRHAEAVKTVKTELQRVGITRTSRGLRRNHQEVARDRTDKPEALKFFDESLAALRRIGAEAWSREQRLAWLRQTVEKCAGQHFGL
jgi:hypothetical protein